MSDKKNIIKAFAKVNIGLNVLDQRGDGYHNIETIFAPINLYDTLQFFDSDEISIETNWKHLPVDEHNLCYKAAKILKEKYAPDKGVHIDVTKKIPIGAGLGGGSSDAAHVLNELNKLWKLDLPDDELFKTALSLGSDVPYFLKGGVAYALGRGEELTYLDLQFPYYVIIVYPNLCISTKWAYEKYQEKEASKLFGYDKFLQLAINEPDIFREKFTNDFEKIVFTRYAGLISIKNVLYEKGALFASLSGTGSALFGFYLHEKTALRAYDTFSSRFQTFISYPDFN
jgi:4-diphosphocytidyl-2-C-methyl-D-erythritol kinase